jgi:hypothetical protein
MLIFNINMQVYSDVLSSVYLKKVVKQTFVKMKPIDYL